MAGASKLMKWHNDDAAEIVTRGSQRRRDNVAGTLESKMAMIGLS